MLAPVGRAGISERRFRLDPNEVRDGLSEASGVSDRKQRWDLAGGTTGGPEWLPQRSGFRRAEQEGPEVSQHLAGKDTRILF